MVLVVTVTSYSFSSRLYIIIVVLRVVRCRHRRIVVAVGSRRRRRWNPGVLAVIPSLLSSSSFVFAVVLSCSLRDLVMSGAKLLMVDKGDKEDKAFAV